MLKLMGLRKKFRVSVEEYEHKLASKSQTPLGGEVPDPVPLEPPVGYFKQPSMIERVRDMVRSEHLRIAAEAAGAETFDEADDFEVEDDPEPISAYEFERHFEPPVEVPGATRGAPGGAAEVAPGGEGSGVTPIAGATGGEAAPISEPAKAG